jgi:methylenetetrahydrofolate--tRNA-(uracil-5-)-methyltransferase
LGTEIDAELNIQNTADDRRSVTVIGAGLAGSEAAYQLARRGIHVDLYEMRPENSTPAHKTDKFAELVCSNSLRGDDLSNAVGLLKEELRRLGSVIMECAEATRVPAGGAHAVDRELFSQGVTERILAEPNITVHRHELTELPDGRVIIATGPLTSDKLTAAIGQLLTELEPSVQFLNFYDAAAPILTGASIDMQSAYRKSRYDKSGDDYINCPMNKEEYIAFWRELCAAEQAEVHGFDDGGVFEGCMPVEVMARRGEDALRYGPLKPVGLRDPRTGQTPYAVVQLRQDNREGTLFNIVGFQTHLKFGEQKRVFGMIPALAGAEFVRYGVMHRNTFINSPLLLDEYYRLRKLTRVAFAGQITGVEGYVESTASGYLAASATAAELLGRPLPRVTRQTAIGALARYVSGGAVSDFQPMNINFGIIEPLGERIRNKKEKNTAIAERGLAALALCGL